nr:hypothetical protein [Tanacetum cinerariifolium]
MIDGLGGECKGGDHSQVEWSWRKEPRVAEDMEPWRNFPITHSTSTSRFAKKIRSQENKIKKGKNVEDEPQEPVAAGRWLPVEEELLATCYVAVSKDNKVGRSQKHETFWYRVLNEFNSKKFQKRTKDMLTSKWHTLNANCQKFNAAYKRAKRLEKSGEDDVDLMKRAQSIYRDEHKGVSFSQEDVWAILKFHPKWDAPEQVDLTGDVPEATQEDLFGHDARPRPTGKPRPAKKTKSDATASTGESSTSTQFGELMKQEIRLKREAAERAFEAQAEKDHTLMRLEELRFLATSTKYLDDDETNWIKNPFFLLFLRKKGSNNSMVEHHQSDKQEDRITELPDCLLIEIISSLPETKEAIRTGTLTKQWQNLWPDVLNLIFINQNYYELEKFVSLVDKTLTKCSQLNLHKFAIRTSYDVQFESPFNSWIRYAVSRNVQDLELNLTELVSDKLVLDQFMFINSCLTHLKLRCCVFNPTCNDPLHKEDRYIIIMASRQSIFKKA